MALYCQQKIATSSNNYWEKLDSAKTELKLNIKRKEKSCLPKNYIMCNADNNKIKIEEQGSRANQV